MREQAGREACPTAAIVTRSRVTDIDSQSVQATQRGALGRSADLQYRDAGVLLIGTLFRHYPFLLKLYTDAGWCILPCVRKGGTTKARDPAPMALPLA
jgi:hypothetical protein